MSRPERDHRPFFFSRVVARATRDSRPPTGSPPLFLQLTLYFNVLMDLERGHRAVCLSSRPVAVPVCNDPVTRWESRIQSAANNLWCKTMVIKSLHVVRSPTFFSLIGHVQRHGVFVASPIGKFI